MAYIKVIDHNESTGELREIYNQLIASRGKLADVHKIQSLNPPSIISHMKLYLDIMFGQSPLKRYQREMIGVIVSATNNCTYCVEHHSQALLHYWKNEARIKSLLEQPANADLSESEVALCKLAREVTVNPAVATRPMIDELRQLGLDDRAVLDAVLVIAYFNFVNRIVLSLGLEVNVDEVSGYSY